MVTSVSRRRQIYRLLSLAFQWPDERFTSTLQETLQRNSAQTSQAVALSDLGVALDELTRLPLEQVQAEYTRLFINGFPTTPCPPYESFYCDGGSLLGSTAEALSLLYARWGLGSGSHLPDHLAVELEFMCGLLSALEASSGDQSDELEATARAFWGEHLGRWAGRFAADLQANAHLAFYQALGAVLSDLAKTEESNWNGELGLSPDARATGRQSVETVLAVSDSDKLTSTGGIR